MNQPIPPPQPPMGPGPTGGPPPYRPYRLQFSRRRRIWPWITGGVLVVVVLAVVIGVGIMVMIGHTTSGMASPSPTHTYPKEYPKQKLPAQIGEYKLDRDGPAVYEILRGSDNNPNRLDVNKSKRIGISDSGIPFSRGGVKKHIKLIGEENKTDELEPGVYCNRDERGTGTNCYAASNSGRIWMTTDHFRTLTREQLARWTTHFLTLVKE